MVYSYLGAKTRLTTVIIPLLECYAVFTNSAAMRYLFLPLGRSLDHQSALIMLLTRLLTK